MDNELICNCSSNRLIDTNLLNEIEDGLLVPENKDLFLTSSLAFLHRHLLKKIETDVNEKTYFNEKKYSDLLIVKTHSDQSRTIYVQLKDVDKFEENLKNESTVPYNKLSIDQILPKPGSVKIRNKRKTTLNIFNKKSSGNISISSRYSLNFFNIFKKSSVKFEEEPTNELKETPSIYTTKSKMEVIIKFLQTIPNEPHKLTPVPSIIDKFTPKMVEISDLSLPVIIRPKPSNYLKERYENLTMDEMNALNKIVNKPCTILRVSKSETFNKVRLKNDDERYEIKESDLTFNNKCQLCECCIANYNKEKCCIEMKKPLSKISVLDEQSEDDEDEERFDNSTSSSIFHDFDNEIKSTITSSVLKDIIKKFVEDL